MRMYAWPPESFVAGSTEFRLPDFTTRTGKKIEYVPFLMVSVTK